MLTSWGTTFPAGPGLVPVPNSPSAAGCFAGSDTSKRRMFSARYRRRSPASARRTGRRRRGPTWLPPSRPGRAGPAPAVERRPMLIGRDRELRILNELIAQILESGAALVVLAGAGRRDRPACGAARFAVRGLWRE